LLVLVRSCREKPASKLGDDQFAKEQEWKDAGLLALVGIGVDPGLSDVFARYAEDELFSEIDELGVRDGSNFVVAGLRLRPRVLDLGNDRDHKVKPRHGVEASPLQFCIEHRARKLRRASRRVQAGQCRRQCRHPSSADCSR
jgi:hypothetical protein